LHFIHNQNLDSELLAFLQKQALQKQAHHLIVPFPFIEQESIIEEIAKNGFESYLAGFIPVDPSDKDERQGVS